jgi:hypothetical protein
MVNTIAFSRFRSPLLGGEATSKYIGDIIERPVYPHGPATWDSHADPPDPCLSLLELHAHDSSSQPVANFLEFPPAGSFPSVTSIPLSCIDRSLIG